MPSSFFRIISVAAGLSASGNIPAQDITVTNHRLNLTPAYTYYGSIDEIHSPYRYGGRDFSMMVSYAAERTTGFHVLSLSYESVVRYPAHLPTSESIVLQSYDNSRGSYIWPTTSSFLKKQTYWIKQTYSGYHRLPWHFLSGNWYVGYNEDMTLINCPNLPMLELFSLAIGAATHCAIPLTRNISYELNLKLLLLSADVRNSYATVDGYVGEEKNVSYYYNYLLRHTRIHGIWNHTALSVQQGINYKISPNFELQTGCRITYRSLATPRQLKSMIISYQMGLQYAW